MRGEQHSPDDPLNLDDVDQKIRINELNERVKELGMEQSGVSEDCPPDVHEQFLQNILHFENAELTSDFDQLSEAGVALPPPEQLNDEELHAKLWEIINGLAARNTFLSSTDHLSDRELYAELWSEGLREMNPRMPPGSGWVHHLDLIGSGSEEDIEIYLRFYADDAYRAQWLSEFPDTVMPPREKAPYDRDRLLPQAPEWEVPEEDEDDEAEEIE